MLLPTKHPSRMQSIPRSRTKLWNHEHRNTLVVEVVIVEVNKVVVEVIVESNVEKISNARLLFHQKVIETEKNSDLVNGKVEVCFIDLATKKPQKFSDDLLLIFI